ncbi:MAG: hypothetical protein RLZZ450_7011 [Pseudomonadota bacterium]|jgi:uncharacterized metal-binding protein YceD (DUF177 family)
MPALVIPIQQLDSVSKDFVFALDEAWLKGAFANSDVRGDTSRPGSVTIHAQRNGNEILVHGAAHGWLIAQCGRCLNDVSVEVACDLAALYAPQAGAVKRHNDDDDEDLELDAEAPDREFYTGDHVVIDDLVRDYLLLELPMQPRCEPECVSIKQSQLDNGLGSSKRTLDGDIDPRLMPLMKLAKGEPEKE